MRKRRLIVIAALISAILILPVAISLGLLNVPNLPFLGSTVTPLGASSTAVFVDPAAVDDDSLQSGSYFTVYVNISEVTDLYTWHVKISWDKDILNCSEILYGDFLSSGTVSPNGTSSGVANITGIFNGDGYAWVAESVLGDYAGVNDNGTLCTIEFEVLGYGSTDLNITLSGTMPTTLLDSAGVSITFDDAIGYFRNRYPGDIDGDYYCGSADFTVLAGKYGKSYPCGQSAPEREADFDLDCYVGSADFTVLAGKYGQTLP